MGRTGHSPGDWRNVSAAFCLFFHTYLWPFGGGGERQRMGLGGGLGRAGVCAAEGCLDHVNGLGVAHLSQGLHQLPYGAPGDLRNEGRVCFCVPACAGNKQAVNSTPHPVPLPGCLLHRDGQGAWKVWWRASQKKQGASTSSLNQVSCFSSEITQEVTEKHFIVSRETAEAVKLYSETYTGFLKL